MDGCHGGGDEVFTKELDMGATWPSCGQKNHRMQMGVQEETSCIKKKKKEGKCKTPLVTKGYAWQKVIDYDEIFSPIVRHTSIR